MNPCICNMMINMMTELIQLKLLFPRFKCEQRVNHDSVSMQNLHSVCLCLSTQRHHTSTCWLCKRSVVVLLFEARINAISFSEAD